MARRKTLPPDKLPVEAIIWNDAAFVRRGPLDTDPCLMHTVGFVVHEDKTQIILAHEVNSTEDWNDKDMDYTQIPIGMVVSRARLAEVSIMQEEETNASSEV